MLRGQISQNSSKMQVAEALTQGSGILQDGLFSPGTLYGKAAEILKVMVNSGL